MAAVAGLRGTGDFGTDERPKNFREMILFLNANGDSPIFGLTAKAKKKTVDDPEYAWWTEPNDQLILQNVGSVATGTTTITIDSTDPSSSVLDANWGLATHLKPGDMLMVVPATDSASAVPEQLRVENILSSTQFTVTRGAAGTTPATIADDQMLLLMASAYAEGTASPEAVSRNPVKYSNFVQIFKDSYELTGTAEVTKFRTGDPWSNDKKRKMYDHSRAIEWSFLFGRKSEGTGANGKPLRTTDGILAQIPASRKKIFAAGTGTGRLTFENFLLGVYRAFDYTSEAGDERIAFCGNVALNAINKMANRNPAGGTSANVHSVTWGGPVKLYGMNLRELLLPQGRILIRSHPLLNRSGRYISSTWTPNVYNSSMWILDFSCIQYVSMKGRDTRVKDDVQQKDEDLRRGFVQSDCSIMLDKGGLTCCYLGGVTDASLATS
jgi:Family of unknown function (DUF5309)